MIRLPQAQVDRLRSLYEGRSVAVTGGTGFIGGHLVDCLLSVGASVSVIDDLSTSNADHIAELMELEPDRLRFVHGSILDDAALETALAQAGVVFHLAAIGSVQRSIEHPQRSWEVNATGTLRVLEQARAVKASRVVLAASSSAYGDSETLPKIESMLPAPRSPYAASKLAGEQLCASWTHAYGLDTASLRFFNVFGPRQPADSAYAAVIPAFIDRLLNGQRPIIYGDGTQSRDFTYIGNVVLATLLAGSSQQPLGGAVINVGAGERTDLLQLASILAQACGNPELAPEHRETRTGDVRHSLADLTRAAELLGYHPFVSVADGLTQTLDHTNRTRTAGSTARASDTGG